MAADKHDLASHHVPYFITGPGQTDQMLVVVGIVLIAAILAVGVFFFWLHSLPERLVHNRLQYDLVAVLALISLFTHIHAFWIAALLLAFVRIPEFSISDVLSPLRRISTSLETIASNQPTAAAPAPAAPATASAAKANPPASQPKPEAKGAQRNA